MLTKKIVIGSRNILPDGQIEVRYDTYILEDGITISGPTYLREVIHPGQDITDKVPEIQRIAVVEHTPEVVALYESKSIRD